MVRIQKDVEIFDSTTKMNFKDEGMVYHTFSPTAMFKIICGSFPVTLWINKAKILKDKINQSVSCKKAHCFTK